MNESEFLGVLKTLTMQFYQDYSHNKLFHEIKSILVNEEVLKDGVVDFNKLELVFDEGKLNVEDILHMMFDDIRCL